MSGRSLDHVNIYLVCWVLCYSPWKIGIGLTMRTPPTQSWTYNSRCGTDGQNPHESPEVTGGLRRDIPAESAICLRTYMQSPPVPPGIPGLPFLAMESTNSVQSQPNLNILIKSVIIEY